MVRIIIDSLIASIIILISIIVLVLISLEGVTQYYHFKEGKSIKTAVIDSGLKLNDKNLTKNVIKPFDVIHWNEKPTDTIGHGTAVTGIIEKIDPKTKIIPIKILDKDSGYEKAIDTPVAILYAVIHGARVINMSFAEPKDYLTEMTIEYGRMHGVIFVAATGNEKKNKNAYPSNYPGVLPITGVNEKNDQLFEYSNIGKSAELAAPSVDIMSIDATSKKKKYVYESGTSMASAFITGTVAYLLENHPEWNQTKIKQYLEENSLPVLPYQNRPTKQLHAVQIDKIKARENKQLYVNGIPSTYATNQSKISIMIDQWGVDSLEIKDETGIHSVPVGTKTMTIPLIDGYNNIQIVGYKKGKKIEKKLQTILKNAEKPKIDYVYSGKMDSGKMIHIFSIISYELQDVYVNGKNENQYVADELQDGDKGKITYMLFAENVKMPLHVEAVDTAGNKEELTITKPIGFSD